MTQYIVKGSGGVEAEFGRKVYKDSRQSAIEVRGRGDVIVTGGQGPQGPQGIQGEQGPAGDSVWQRVGTTLSPTTAGDNLSLDASATFEFRGQTFSGIATGAADNDQIATKGYADSVGGGGGGQWQRIGTTLSPQTAGDGVSVDGGSLFNSALGDNDFTIKKQTSGDAYIYDAGNDEHVWSGDWESDFFKYSSSKTGGVSCFFAGDLAGSATNTGEGNTFVGFRTGRVITSGYGNVGLGGYCLDKVTTGFRNIGIGYHSLDALTTASRNVSIGYYAGNRITSGSSNVLIGGSSGGYLTTGYSNVALGNDCLLNATTGYRNFALGPNTLEALTTGFGNIGIGHFAMRSAQNGNRAVAIGYEAGYLSNASDCIYLGSYAGRSNTTPNRIYIGTVNGNELIYGETDNELLRVNGDFETTGQVGFNGSASISKPTITGSRGGNAALASLLTALASYGLITDSTT